MFFKSAKRHLHRLCAPTPPSQQSGFTLIELLVSIIVGAIIVSSMLFLVLELLKVSKREEVLTLTQQDMRRALAYMASDVGEADYVYADPAQVTRIASEVEGDPRWPAGATPVLAFWRLDPIDMGDLPANPAPYNENDPDGCIAEFDGDRESECSTLKIRQSAYSLVIYLIAENDETGIWEGPARIIRYELPKYTDVEALEQTPGYDDPSIDNPNAADGSFADWVVINGPPEGNAQVLTDHVDLTEAAADWVDCPDVGAYLRVPEIDNTEDPLNSFYVCARIGDDIDQIDGQDVRVGSLSQSLIINLTGNIEQSPATAASSTSSKLPALQSEVLIRGVIEKRVTGDD
jgi:prepilin-type N-terminal cleavage/methylation domain-containing protein